MTRLAVAIAFAATLAAQEQFRVRLGDDIAWADPNYDDSGWEVFVPGSATPIEVLAVNRSWTRHRVEVPAGEPSVLVVRFCACEFYLNGIRIGATADLTGSRPESGRAVQVVWLPANTPPGEGLLAVRRYHTPGQVAISGRGLSLIQLVGISRLQTTLDATYNFRFMGEVAAILLFLLAAVLVTLAGQRFDRLSILICAYLLVAAIISFLYRTASPGDYSNHAFWALALSPLLAPLAVSVLAILADVRLRPLWVVPCLAFHFTLRAVFQLEYLRPAPVLPASTLLYLLPATHLLAFLLSLFICLKGWRKPGVPRILLGVGALTLLTSLLGGASRLGITARGIPLFGETLGWERVANLVFSVLAVVYLVRRAGARRAEEQRLKSELEAARSVQSLLLGQTLPAGIDAVYFSASEVGGDFYQVIPAASGSVLIVTGDVSGKGLQAAMLVATISGALGNLLSHQPAAVLAHLGRCLRGKTQGGFVTCCCALFDPDGRVTLANAGHLPPYLEGREVELESGLPLGVVDGVVYEETVVGGGDFVFLSDGVVEAANADGELFGFERTRAMSRQSAQQIAEAAKAWGQNDDITVVTVRRLA